MCSDDAAYVLKIKHTITRDGGRVRWRYEYLCKHHCSIATDALAKVGCDHVATPVHVSRDVATTSTIILVNREGTNG